MMDGRERLDVIGMTDELLLDRMRTACAGSFGSMESSFLCKSLGTLTLPDPVIVEESTSVREALKRLKETKTGSILVVDESGRLQGIFTERDCLTKIVGLESSKEDLPVADFMTRDPQRVKPDCTIAFALNLMSHGGFRNLPIVDNDDHPLSALSVKHVIDAIVASMLDDILSLEDTLI